MRKNRTAFKIWAFLLILCLKLPSYAVAQTGTSQGLWWEIERDMQIAPPQKGVADKGWNDPHYESSALKGISPSFGAERNVIGGQSFTINDSAKCPTGQVTVTGNANQSTLRVMMDASLTTTDGYACAGYSFSPNLYVENGENRQLRVTLKVVSHAEGAAKLLNNQGFNAEANGTLDCMTIQQHNPQFDTPTVSARHRPLTWKGDDSFEETTTFFVTPQRRGELPVGRLIESPDDTDFKYEPHMPWPFAGKTKKGFYKISFVALLSQFKNLPKATGRLTSIWINNHAYEGEVSGAIKQEVIITVGQVGPPPPVESAIGVDYNRDGTIDYDNADKTSAANPFDFWLNTDCEADEEQENTPTKAQDCADNRISSTRDLEDFTRLHIQPPAAFRTDGTWKCKVNFTNITGSPAIRLYKAVSVGTEYLVKPDVATKQIAPTTTISVGTTPVEIPIELFQSNGANKYRAALLFEATKAGKSALQVHFYKNGKEQTAKAPVYLNLCPIQDFYDYYTLPDFDVNSPPTSCPPPRAASPTLAKSQTSDYILFVHGWRMQEWKKQVFAETSFKRLWQRGYKGKFGFFSWPTGYTPLRPVIHAPQDLGDYNRSERKAWLSAAALREVLTSLNAASPQKVRIFAHSMGNVVVSEALLLEAESQNAQQIVHTYIATQAASVAQAYDVHIEDNGDQKVHQYSGPNVYRSYPPLGLPYFEGTKQNGGLRAAAGRLINYYNAQDAALNSWGLGQLTKPDSASDPVFDYGYESTLATLSGFFKESRNSPTKTKIELRFPENRYEIFSHAAPAFSVALGTQEMPTLRGLFSSNQNLANSPFNFTHDRADHSAQFNSTLMKRYSYWDQLVKDFGIGVTPPK